MKENKSKARTTIHSDTIWYLKEFVKHIPYEIKEKDNL